MLMRKFNQNMKERGSISNPEAIWPVVDKNLDNHKQVDF